MALWAIAGISTFLTGCGDDDGGDDNGGQVVITAPQNDAQLRAQQYSLTAAGAAGQRILIFPAQNSYTITSGANTFTGTYSNPTFSGNQVSVTLTPDNPDQDNQPGVLAMVFSSSAANGTYAFTPAGQGAVEQGTFTYTPVGDPDPDPTGPQFAPADQAGFTAQSYAAQLATAGNTVLSFPTANTYQLATGSGTQSGTLTAARDGEVWTASLLPTGGTAASTMTLTFTGQNGGTVVYNVPGSGTDSGTFLVEDGPPVDPNPTGTAPDSIVGSWNLNVTQGPFSGDFIATYQGNTFNILRSSDNASMGNGTYTYTPSGDNATLVHNYATGVDVDDYNLAFTTATSATFTGTQTSGVGATPQPASGTFVKVP